MSELNELLADGILKAEKDFQKTKPDEKGYREASNAYVDLLKIAKSMDDEAIEFERNDLEERRINIQEKELEFKMQQAETEKQVQEQQSKWDKVKSVIGYTLEASTIASALFLGIKSWDTEENSYCKHPTTARNATNLLFRRK